MSQFLPKSLNFVEYRPSMVGIPTEAVGRYYDRLDRTALRAEAEALGVQKTLRENLKDAVPGDRAYLQDLFGKVEGIMDMAQKERNLPGYANQIKEIARDINNDAGYIGIQRTSEQAKKYNNLQMQLAAPHGAENVVASGDIPHTFVTNTADGIQDFRGFASKRPDYLKGADDVFMKNTDIVASEASLDNFIDSQAAFADYTKTPEGRVHINEMSNELFGVPFDRLDGAQDGGPQATQVVNQMNAFLKDAGIRYVKTAKAAKLQGQFKGLEGVAPVTTGRANVSLTDGTEAADGTIGVIDDRVKNSFLDDQLSAFVNRDPEILLYDDASGGKESFKRGQNLQTNQIVSSNLTTQVGPNGRPLIEVQYNQGGTDGEQGIGYYEVPDIDMGHLAQAAEGIKYQLKNYANSATQGTAANAIFNIYDNELNKWNSTGSQEPITSSSGYVIRRLPDGYGFYDADGNPQIVDGSHLKFEKYNEVQNFIGTVLINQ